MRRALLLILTIALAAAAAIGTLALLSAALGLREPLLASVVSIPIVALVAWAVSAAARRWLGL